LSERTGGHCLDLQQESLVFPGEVSVERLPPRSRIGPLPVPQLGAHRDLPQYGFDLRLIDVRDLAVALWRDDQGRAERDLVVVTYR